ININNLKIHYLKKGKGEPVIFLHALFYDSSGYSELFQYLGEHYKVYAIDFPMHGKSENANRAITMSDLSDLVEQFIIKLKIKTPVVCGHSAGAIPAIEFASKNKIKELIIMSPGGLKYYNNCIIPLLRIIFVQPVICVFWNFRKTIPLLIKGQYNLFTNLFNKSFWELIKKNIIKDHTNTMKKISCPTTIFWARYDELIPKKYSNIFQKKIKNSKLIIINGSHDWPILRPKEIIKYLKN
ncbi:alpha/beta hydrolase, partial [Candidatus Woesearchaeota archaeon]|nr:alpha/beta hydrolase [Candidatus Woesearchaeota archaeon]